VLRNLISHLPDSSKYSLADEILSSATPLVGATTFILDGDWSISLGLLDEASEN
jgi:hypothetical protein